MAAARPRLRAGRETAPGPAMEAAGDEQRVLLEQVRWGRGCLSILLLFLLLHRRFPPMPAPLETEPAAAPPEGTPRDKMELGRERVGALRS